MTHFISHFETVAVFFYVMCVYVFMRVVLLFFCAVLNGVVSS